MERWNDDRLDDLHRWLEATAKRTDNIGMIVAGHDLHLSEINRERGRRFEQRWALLLVVLTVILGEIANVALTTLHPPKPPQVTVRITRR